MLGQKRRKSVNHNKTDNMRQLCMLLMLIVTSCGWAKGDDLILVTHEHADHLDTKAIEVLEKPNTRIVANANSQQIIGKDTIMKNGDTRVSGMKQKLEGSDIEVRIRQLQ